MSTSLSILVHPALCLHKKETRLLKNENAENEPEPEPENENDKNSRKM